MTRTLRNFDSAGEDQVLSDASTLHSDDDENNANFDPPARERPAVGGTCDVCLLSPPFLSFP